VPKVKNAYGRQRPTLILPSGTMALNRYKKVSRARGPETPLAQVIP